jgi:NAD(P)-dependent dehydrogenase (short-subunit alcohol dehydrogenase family)
VRLSRLFAGDEAGELESALQIPAEMIHYGATETAQIAVAQGLAETVVGTGITVDSVLPGSTKSRGVNDSVAR